jgi:hypothetical protein
MSCEGFVLLMIPRGSNSSYSGLPCESLGILSSGMTCATVPLDPSNPLILSPTYSGLLMVAYTLMPLLVFVTSVTVPGVLCYHV